MSERYGEQNPRLYLEKPFKKISFERVPATDNELIFVCCDGRSHWKVHQQLPPDNSDQPITERIIAGTETDCNCEDPSATKDVFDIFK